MHDNVGLARARVHALTLADKRALAVLFSVQWNRAGIKKSLLISRRREDGIIIGIGGRLLFSERGVAGEGEGKKRERL